MKNVSKHPATLNDIKILFQKKIKIEKIFQYPHFIII